ncbi:hypothetical protein [Caballeronia sp. ATUFL_M2_KS44]|nr:hypothetical protein [Caballeronia sp. ATUFL_M2_KS44]
MPEGSRFRAMHSLNDVARFRCNYSLAQDFLPTPMDKRKESATPSAVS